MHKSRIHLYENLYPDFLTSFGIFYLELIENGYPISMAWKSKEGMYIDETIKNTFLRKTRFIRSGDGQFTSLANELTINFRTSIDSAFNLFIQVISKESENEIINNYADSLKKRVELHVDNYIEAYDNGSNVISRLREFAKSEFAQDMLNGFIDYFKETRHVSEHNCGSKMKKHIPEEEDISGTPEGLTTRVHNGLGTGGQQTVWGAILSHGLGSDFSASRFIRALSGIDLDNVDFFNKFGETYPGGTTISLREVSIKGLDLNSPHGIDRRQLSEQKKEGTLGCPARNSPSEECSSILAGFYPGLSSKTNLSLISILNKNVLNQIEARFMEFREKYDYRFLLERGISPHEVMLMNGVIPSQDEIDAMANAAETGGLHPLIEYVCVRIQTAKETGNSEFDYKKALEKDSYYGGLESSF
jgi:hypothetical protein